MKLSLLMVVNAVVDLIFGIGLMLAPMYVIALFAPMPMIDLTTNLFGVFLIGFAVLNFFARNVKNGEGLRAILLADLVVNVLGFILALYYQFFGIALATNWFTIIISLVFSVGFAYFLFFKPGRALVAEHQ